VKVIVGLGNPGHIYHKTRHNFGFIIIDTLAENFKIKINHKDYSVWWGKAMLGKEMLVLAKPMTYVNLSGQAVKLLVKKFQPQLKDLLIILDDVNLPWGKFRFRPQGTAGGHNGLQSVIEALGTDDFPRLRLGISGGGEKELSDYVLSEFTQTQKRNLDVILRHVNQAIEIFINDGLTAAMNTFNKTNIFDVP